MKKMNSGLMLLFMALLVALPVFAQNVGSVRGTVSSEDGALIANAFVCMVDNDRNVFDTLTDREGTFTFDRIPVREYHIRAFHEQTGEVQDDLIVAPNEETFIALVLVNNGGGGDDGFGSVSGTVVNAQGQPSAFAGIFMISERREVFQNQTNGAGEFTYERVPVGGYSIRAIDDRQGIAHDQLNVVENEETVIELILIPGPGNANGVGSVIGRVFNGNGRLVPDVEVFLAGERHHNHQLRTDHEGRFAFEEVTAGMYNIMSGHQNYGAVIEQVFVVTDEEAEINLVLSNGRREGGDDPNPGIISGSVSNNLDEPAENAEIILTNGMGYLFRVMTDDQGNFTLEQIPRGDYHITAVLDKLGLVEDDLVVTAGGQTEINLVMGAIETGIDTDGASDVNVPVRAVLLDSYPNPFNPVATVAYNLPESGFVTLSVFNTAGQRLKTLTKGWQTAGEYQTTFDGHALPAGTYIIRLEAGAQNQTQRLLLLK